MEGFSLAILPDFVRMVAVLDEDRVGVPILFLPQEECAALKDENTLSTRSKAFCESAAASPGPDDDEIVMICAHVLFVRLPMRFR